MKPSLPTASTLLLLTAISAVYGQESSLPVASAAAGLALGATAAVGDQAPSSSKSFIRLEGTDLHLGSLPPITFHGFGSQGFIATSDYTYLARKTTSPSGSFDLSHGSAEFAEFGVNASVSPFNRTRIAAQGFAYDVGNVGNYSPMLDYALVEYTVTDWLGLRGGRIRRPGGIYNHIQDVDVARTFVMLPQGMYDARWRDFSTSVDGGELFGNISLGKAGSLSYEAFVGLSNFSADGGVAHWIMNGTAPGSTFDTWEQPLYVGGQLWYNTPVNGLRAGAYVGHMDGLGFDITIPQGGPVVSRAHSAGDVSLQQYSMEYQWKAWTFQAEYFTYLYDFRQDVNTYMGTMLLPPPFSSSGPGRTEPDSWYASAAYRVNKWLEVGAYYTEFYENVHNRNGVGNGTPSDANQKDVAVALRFDPKPWWTIKLEGHHLNGTALLQNDAANPVRDDRAWWMLAVKTTISF